MFNSLRPAEKYQHLANNIFKFIFVTGNYLIFNSNFLQFFHKGLIDNDK